jgi:16S rRNA (cytidine1402-2'-O)-methyltransferase
MQSSSTVYLIPIWLHADFNTATIPPYTFEVLECCEVFFVEHEKSARQFIKKIIPNFDINAREWHKIEKGNEESLLPILKKVVLENKKIGVMSEAGCPGVADPGQLLVQFAQQMGVQINPLVGASSILLALMASGMNGQTFMFHGYLPIQPDERKKKIVQLEAESKKNNCTQIFIEAPYRNDAMMEALLQTLQPSTNICIGKNITAVNESIITKKAVEWKTQKPFLHKELVIFLIHVH